MRVSEIQASPLFMMALGIISGMDTSRSTSSRRMAADFPPSSRLNRLRLAPQAAPIFLPAAVDPVKETLSTPGWLTRCSPTSRPAGTTLSTPLGSPASAKISASTLASSGVSGAGLNTTVLPDSRAGPAWRGQKEGDVPRGDGRHHADRLLGHQDRPQEAVLDRVEGERRSQAGVVVEDHGRGQHLGHQAPRDRRAHLIGDELGDALHVVADRLGHLGQDGAALDGGHVGPGPVVECLAGGGHRPVDVGDLGLGGPPDQLPVVGETTSKTEEEDGSTHSPPMNRRSYDFTGPPLTRADVCRRPSHLGRAAYLA